MKARSKSSAESARPKSIRRAIYTRVSTDDGLEKDFNSLDAQRESAESFIAAFKHEGCSPCESAMVHTYTKKRNGRLYRYYVCHRAQTQGWKSCPTKSVPAEEIERFVVDHIRVIGRDPEMQSQALHQRTPSVAKRLRDRHLRLADRQQRLSTHVRVAPASAGC